MTTQTHETILFTILEEQETQGQQVTTIEADAEPQA